MSWRDTIMTHTEMCDRIDELEAENKSLALRLDAALADLEEASPMRTCARCGKQDRAHRLIWEEGDEMECLPCNERENARERAELHDNNSLATSANPDDDVQEFAVEKL